MTPLFSLCQTTARLPMGWAKAARAWWRAADHPEQVEHILAVDSEDRGRVRIPADLKDRIKLVSNYSRRCAVDGWNATVKHARGQFLITVADDWYPCPHWDTQIRRLVPDMSKEVVLDVNTGGDPGILTFSLLTRAYLNRLMFGSLNGVPLNYAGFFYPEYIGMMADFEFGEIARAHGVIQDATHLYFPHDHPYYTGRPMDPVHQWQHRPEAMRVGEEVFIRRLEAFSGQTIPRHQDKPGMPPLHEMFGIACEPGLLDKMRALPKPKPEPKPTALRAGDECEVRTWAGWKFAKILIRRRNGTVRAQTLNGQEFESQLDGVREPTPMETR